VIRPYHEEGDDRALLVNDRHHEEGNDRNLEAPPGNESTIFRWAGSTGDGRVVWSVCIKNCFNLF
jgi:hypothetical protein